MIEIIRVGERVPTPGLLSLSRYNQKQKNMPNKNRSITELLTVEATYLSNERTLLAYVRTFIVFLSSGFAILKLKSFEDLMSLGYVLLGLSPVILIWGVFRFFKVRKLIKRIEAEPGLESVD